MPDQRMLLRTGAVAIGVLFGPDLIFGAVVGGFRLIRAGRSDQFLVLMPVMAAFVACALWGFLVGHWYVRNWFLSVAIVWNMWAAFDMFARNGQMAVRASGILWLAWSLRFFGLLMKRLGLPSPGDRSE
ncbi:MAG TPA: hypothetical protein VJ553_02995 [Candidatus Paceibacterota bacterium]|nr:hypothetical protein [Candidatus Paceibacterota bacterium]